MREGTQPKAVKGSSRAESGTAGPERTGSDLERRFPAALALYVILAALAWFTLGEGTIIVGGKPVELRMLPLLILGGLAFRTVLALQAEKIRRGGEKGGSSKP